MTSRPSLFPLFVLFFCCFSLSAQRPVQVKFEGKLSQDGFRGACPGASTGNVKVGVGVPHKSSNNKFLCFNDALIITVDGLTKFQDPNMSTKAGVGYIFYDCKPTKDGPNLQTVLTDSCLNKKSPIIINGLPVNQTNGLWIAKDTGWVRQVFRNDGYLQNTYNGGKPVQFWFAAVTLDNVTSDVVFEKDGNGVSGSCIAVNIDSAFSVVYLNEVKIANLSAKNNGANNYTGTFTVTGGLPEFDLTANYTKVSIVNKSDPNKIGKLTNGPATNGKVMTFTVPTPGKYDVIIEDINGCQMTTSFTVDENPGIIKVGCADGKIGDEICYSITIGQIPDLTSTQFLLSFNTQVLQYTTAKNLNPVFGTIDGAVITNDIDRGFIKFFWFDFNLMPHDFTPETQVVQLCFRIKGPPGPSVFRIIPRPGNNLPNLELSNLDGNSIPLSTATGSVFECTSNIQPSSTLDAYYNQCGQGLFGQVFGGTAPYKVSYKSILDPTTNGLINVSSPATLSPIFANLAAGKYELEVTDAANSKIKDTFNINGNTLNITIDFSNRGNPSCKGNDGNISADIVTGGTAPFRFLWSTGSISPTISQLPVGKYSVTVTDAQGCMSTDSVNLVTEKVKAAILVQNLPTCLGKFDGNVVPDFGNITGVRPFQPFKWIGNGTLIGNRFSGLGKGRVGLIVTDFRGCSDTAYSDVGAIKDIKAEVTKLDVLCFGQTDGSITIDSIKYTTGQNVLDSVFITNPLGIKNYFGNKPVRYQTIGAGTYPIYIKDSEGCEFRDTVKVLQPQPLDTVRVLVKPETCFPGNDGRIEITMTGGTKPYKFTWAGFPTDTNIRVNLTQGNYSVTISDKNGCRTGFANLPFSFNRPPIPVNIDTTAILCFGQGAALTAKAAGGFVIKSYKWSNGDTTAIAKNVLANIPTIVEVTDVQGCKGFDTVVLSQPTRIRLIDSTILPSLCPGLDQGRISLLASGGTGPYLYSLTGGPAQNFGQFSKLKSGKYTVTISDSNLCTGLVITTEIIEPPTITGVFDTSSFRSVKCAGTGDCTGQARLLLSGGTDPLNRFRVRWESNEVTQNSITSTADSLCAGTQKVTVTDGNGCNTTLQFNIASPDFISRDQIRTTVTDIVCAGLSNGSVNYIAFGGTSPYTYQWSDGNTNRDRSGLTAGKYALKVTDLNNCTFIDSVQISEPLSLIASLDTIKTRSITCPGSADGQIGVKASGGNLGKLTYTWSPSFSDTNFVRNVKPGIYTLVVSDSKGCKDTLDNITMMEPLAITPTLSLRFTARCANDTAGVFVTSVSGGNGASYSYSINNGNSIPISNRIPLKAGTYQLTVFDRKGCAVDTTIKVLDPPAFNIELGPDKSIRLGDSIRITTIGNNPLAKVSWQNAGEVTCLSADCSLISVKPFKNTVFVGMALDQSGCKAIDQINIIVDSRRAVYIPNAFRPDQLSANQDFRFFSGSGVVAIHYGRIFNRWGVAVSEVQNLPPDPGGVVIWDGRFRGGPAEPGVYVYVIDVEFSDGVRLIYKGDVTLIR